MPVACGRGQVIDTVTVAGDLDVYPDIVEKRDHAASVMLVVFGVHSFPLPLPLAGFTLPGDFVSVSPADFGFSAVSGGK